jgi:hypothetical protein
MAELQSHNDALASSLKHSLVPSVAQVVVYLLGSLLLLTVLNAGAIWDFFNSSVGVSSETANAVVNDQFGRFSDFTGNLFDGRLAPMLFWAFLGVLTYMIVWLFQNTSLSVRNDLAARDFKHPLTLDRRRYWETVGANKIFLVCSLVLAGVFIYLCVVYFIPIFAHIFYAAIYDWHLVNSLFRILWSTLATATLIYFLLTVFRLGRNAWRSITSSI